MNWLEALFYGMFTGFSEFVPVSSRAHGSILRYLFGQEYDPLQAFMVRLGALLGLLVCCRQMLGKFLYEVRVTKRYSRTRSARGTLRGTYDLRLVKIAFVPMLLSLLFYSVGDSLENDRLMLSVFLVLNGIILFVTDHMRQGNKDARLMSGFDSIGIGVFSVFSAFPGLSRFGGNVVFAVVRGADKQHAVTWALLLSIPALILLMLMELISLLSGGWVLGSFLCYLFTAAGSFIGAYLGILLVRTLAVRAGFSGYAYYCWGVAVFCFVLYLIV